MLKLVHVMDRQSHLLSPNQSPVFFFFCATVMMGETGVTGETLSSIFMIELFVTSSSWMSEGLECCIVGDADWLPRIKTCPFSQNVLMAMLDQN